MAESAAIVGEPLELKVQVSGIEGKGPQRVGLAWANSSTGAIAQRMLTPQAFDETQWTKDPLDEDSEATFAIEAVPEQKFLFVRGVAELNGLLVWGDEVRLATEPPEPPLDLELQIKGLPQQSYRYNMHTLRINATGETTKAVQIGFFWSTSPTTRWDPLDPGRFDGSQILDGPVDLPGEIRLPAWKVGADSTLHLRPWALINDTFYWGKERVLDVTQPPLYDHKTPQADHTITIDASSGPLPHLDTFRPQEIHIQRGESVQWVNHADTIHTASRDTNDTSFHTGNLGPDAASEPFRFLLPGEYSYRCRIHPETMEAVLVVTQ